MLRILALCVAVATVLGATAAQGQGRLTPDQQYLAAREAYAKGNAAALATHARALKGHILEPYAEFWQLRLVSSRRRRARSATSSAGTPARSSRSSSGASGCSSSASGSSGSSSTPRSPNLVLDDPDVNCYSLQSRWRRGDGAVVAGFAACGRARASCPRLRADRRERDRGRQAHHAPRMGARPPPPAGGAGRRREARARLPAGERAARGPHPRFDPLAAGEVHRARRKARPQAARQPRAAALCVLAAGAGRGVGRREPLDEEAAGAAAPRGPGVGVGPARHARCAEPRRTRGRVVRERERRHAHRRTARVARARGAPRGRLVRRPRRDRADDAARTGTTRRGRTGRAEACARSGRKRTPTSSSPTSQPSTPSTASSRSRSSAGRSRCRRAATNRRRTT